MRIQRRWYFTLLLFMILLTILPSVSCGVSKEKQEVIDYIDIMLPAMGAHADFYEDWYILMQTSNPDRYELIDEIGDMLNEMEDIYMDVNTSMPPPILREFKSKWSDECELSILALAKTIQALEENDRDLLFEAQELMFQANDAKYEATEELYDVIQQYDIEIGRF